MQKYLRKIKVPDNEEEERAANKQIIVVFAYVGKRGWAGLCDCLEKLKRKRERLVSQQTRKMGS